MQYHVGAEKIDLATLRAQLRTELMANVDGQVRQSNVALDTLHLQLSKLEEEKAERGALIAQLLAEYPAITRMTATAGQRAARGDAAPGEVMVLTLDAEPPLAAADLERIRAGLAVRFPASPVEVVQSAPVPAKRTGVRARARSHG